MTFVVLICCVCASLAGGVLLAYGVCLGLFDLFRVHAAYAAEERERNSPAKAGAVSAAAV